VRRCAAAALAVVLALTSAPQPLVAQTSPGKPAAPAKPAASPTPTPSPSPSPSPTPVAAPPPYEPQLLRLSELMGALSYLRDLCRDGDGAQFRDKMAKLLEIEARTPERKELLAGAFNRGFGDFELTYRACTASARETIVNYLDETDRIAREVATRYGG
jgi:uncharacterized protein (TIGR02301 family)